MRVTLLVVLLVLIPQTLLAYEPSLFNVKSPADLESGQAEIKIQHRFYGDVTDEPLKNFLGADTGANVCVGLRYILSGLELNASRLRNRREYILAAGYGRALPGIPLRGQLDFHFFRYEEFDLEINDVDNKSGVFGLLSLQTEPIHNRLSAAVNLGYDNEEEEFGAGLGVAIAVYERMGTLQKVSVIGEYFPTTNGDENEQSYAFGLRFETYGHHFDFILGNNTEMGVRRLMSGVMKNADLHFGFNIKRRT